MQIPMKLSSVIAWTIILRREKDFFISMVGYYLVVQKHILYLRTAMTFQISNKVHVGSIF